jgi:hypothetical protein
MEMSSISILIEWENAISADPSRAVRMLHNLGKDLEEIGPDFYSDVEIVSGFDPTGISFESVEGMLREGLGALSWVTIRNVALPGKNYYEMKNELCREARGEIVVLLDSDVIPSPGWLKKLLESFEDPAVQICASSVHLASSSLQEKTLALIWFAEVASPEVGLKTTGSILANSMAYRRGVVLKFPFPKISGTARMSCAVHARELRAAGIPMHRRMDAHVEHPAPVGVREFVERALARGRDKVLGSPKPFWKNIAYDVKRGLGCIGKRKGEVGVKLTEVPGVLLIASAWWLLMILGGLAAMIAPKEMGKRLQL